MILKLGSELVNHGHVLQLKLNEMLNSGHDLKLGTN